MKRSPKASGDSHDTTGGAPAADDQMAKVLYDMTPRSRSQLLSYLAHQSSSRRGGWCSCSCQSCALALLVATLCCVASAVLVLGLLHAAGYSLSHRSANGERLPITQLTTPSGLQEVTRNLLLNAIASLAVDESSSLSTQSTASKSAHHSTETTATTAAKPNSEAKLASMAALSSSGDSVASMQPVATQSTPSHVKRDVRFVNNLDHAIKLYWVNNEKQEQFLTDIPADQSSSFGTFQDHVFVFRSAIDNSHVRTAVIANRMTQVRAKVDGESTFHTSYEERTGRGWINVYPRDRMIHHVHDPVSVGHKFTVRTTAPYMHVEPGSAEYPKDLQADGTPAGELELQVETLATDPRIFLVENFLSEFETTKLIELTVKTGALARSVVTTEATVHYGRTSSSMFLNYDNQPFMANLYRRGFQLMGVKGGPSNYTYIGENFQMLHYALEQHYSPHHDYFDPKLDVYKTNAGIQKGNNRMGTLFLYLNDVDQGGETVFPQVNGRYVNDACSSAESFKVKAKRGRAIIFYSMMPDGNLDEHSLHGGCPVKSGEKWAANWWFWDPYRYEPHNI